MSVDLQPFNSVKVCPKCGFGVKGYYVKYSTSTVVEVGDGQFIDVGPCGAEPWPHLEKHCPHCGWGWLEHPKDAEP